MVSPAGQSLKPVPGSVFKIVDDHPRRLSAMAIFVRSSLTSPRGHSSFRTPRILMKFRSRQKAAAPVPAVRHRESAVFEDENIRQAEKLPFSTPLASE